MHREVHTGGRGCVCSEAHVAGQGYVCGEKHVGGSRAILHTGSLVLRYPPCFGGTANGLSTVVTEMFRKTGT